MPKPLPSCALSLVVVLLLPACVHKTEVVVVQPPPPSHHHGAPTTRTAAQPRRTVPAKVSPAEMEVVSSYDEKPR